MEKKLMPLVATDFFYTDTSTPPTYGNASTPVDLDLCNPAYLSSSCVKSVRANPELASMASCPQLPQR